jgi:archaellum component FlaC|tara:strand:- start:106 stop:345 length:240 start_codon:yes stop_codon:yes gene_type:complete
MTTDMKKIEELNKDVESMEKELAEAKKTLRELRTKGLREAMEAKKLADEAVKEEMKALGVTYSQDSYEFNPFTGWRRLL